MFLSGCPSSFTAECQRIKTLLVRFHILCFVFVHHVGETYKRICNYPMVIATLPWGHEWSGKSILVRSDNLAVVDILNKGRSNSPAVMPFIRRLTWISVTHQFILRIEHIPGYYNAIAYSLFFFFFSDIQKIGSSCRVISNPGTSIFCHNILHVNPSISELIVICQEAVLNSIAASTLSSYWTTWCSFRSFHEKFNLCFPSFDIATLSSFISHARLHTFQPTTQPSGKHAWIHVLVSLLHFPMVLRVHNTICKM